MGITRIIPPLVSTLSQMHPVYTLSHFSLKFHFSIIFLSSSIGHKLIAPMRATCHHHLIVHDIITLIIRGCIQKFPDWVDNEM